MSNSALARNAIAAAVVVSSLVFLVVPLQPQMIIADGPPKSTTGIANQADQLSAAFRRAATAVLPSTVTIQAIGQFPSSVRSLGRADDGAQPYEARKVSPDDSEDTAARTGTGVIIHRDGVILTNDHIVKGAEIILVRLADGREFESTEFVTDSRTDLAIVRIRVDEPLPEAKLGNSGDVRVGDWVMAIGSPFGLEASVSAGIIGSIDRELEDTPGTALLQTDAASNPGSSGGPLINLRGEVVGINEGGYGYHEGNQGIGFAIPVNVAKWVSQELLENGTVRRSRLGCVSEKLRPEVAQCLGLDYRQHGIVLTEIMPDAPAARAGLQVGDVVTHFEEHHLLSSIQFGNLIERAPPGKPHRLRGWRAGESFTSLVRLEASSDMQLAEGVSSKANGDLVSDQIYEELGLAVEPLNPEQAKELGLPVHAGGILVSDVRPKSAAYVSGIGDGMVIQRVGGQEIRSLEDFKAALESKRKSNGILLLVYSSTKMGFIVLKP